MLLQSTPNRDEQVCILCGGLGTRIRSVLHDRPKILAPMGNQTFLDLLLDVLQEQGFRRFLLLAGHLGDAVEAYLRDEVRPRCVDATFGICIEPRPLGTAGALKFAESKLAQTSVVVNGDSFQEFDATALLDLHRRHDAIATMLVKSVDDASEYGTVDVNSDDHVVAFREKMPESGAGMVNAGVYVLEKAILRDMPSDESISLEHDVFPRLIARGEILCGFRATGRFIDIGTPDRYRSLRDALDRGAVDPDQSSRAVSAIENNDDHT